MQSFRSYALRVLSVAWRDSFSRARSTLTGVLALFAAAAWPFTNITVDFSNPKAANLVEFCISFVVIWLGILILRLIAAPYFIYRQQREEIFKQGSEIERLNAAAAENVRPKIAMRIEKTFTGEGVSNDGQKEVVLCSLLALSNTGVPSSLDKWEIKLQKPGSPDPFPTCFYFIPKNSTFKGIAGELKLGESDNIMNKAVAPLQTGSIVRGWLMAATPYKPQAELFGSVLEISAADLWGKRVSAKAAFGKLETEISFPPYGTVPDFKPMSKSSSAKWGYSAKFDL